MMGSVVATLGAAKPYRQKPVGSTDKAQFRLYPYGSVQFVDPRVTTPLTFAHVTDLHLTPSPVAESEKVYRGAIDWRDRTFNRPHQVLPKVLAEIRDANVDFVFFGGDNIDCYHPATAERVIKLARDYGLNTYFQSGNHDWETLHIRYVTHDYDATWRATALQKLVRHWNMPAPYYSFEKKGVRFIALDPPYRRENGEWKGRFDIQQTEWFLNRLRYEGPLIIFHHIPFNRPTLEPRLRTVWNGAAPCVAEDRNGDRIMRAIEACPNILGTFTGHAHIRSEDALGQTCQFMTAPASDGQWRYVKVGNADPPKSLRASGLPDLPLRSH